MREDVKVSKFLAVYLISSNFTNIWCVYSIGFAIVGFYPYDSHTDPKQPQHTHCNGIVLLSKSSSSRYSSPSSETKDDPWLVYNHIRNGARSPFIYKSVKSVKQVTL